MVNVFYIIKFHYCTSVFLVPYFIHTMNRFYKFYAHVGHIYYSRVSAQNEGSDT
jgi:hypothetical protein